MTTVHADHDLAMRLRMLWYTASPSGPDIDDLVGAVKDAGWAPMWPPIDPDNRVTRLTPEQLAEGVLRINARYQLPETRQQAFDPEVHALRSVQRGIERELTKLPEPKIVVFQEIKTVTELDEQDRPITGMHGMLRRHVEGLCIVRLLGSG